jgi:imidazolonepropionase-like amidohydrolase/Tol biopolymer transport system component
MRVPFVTTVLAVALSLNAPALAGEWDIEDSGAPSSVLEFTATEGTWIGVDVAPDGKTIVFDLLGHLYELPVGGGEATPLTSGRSWNMLPRYSPDGVWIGFTSDRGGSNDLWVLERSTGDLRNISQMDLPVFQCTWSRDGRHLYGSALDMKVRTPLYQFNLYGEHNELIPAPRRRMTVDLMWEHPSEEGIYFGQGGGSLPASGPRIKRFDMRTGETSVYIDRPGGAAMPIISPDGKYLAYVHVDDDETVLVLHELQTRNENVLVRGLDRGRFESANFYGAYPNMSWHPNGREIFLTYGGKIHAVDIGAGTTSDIPFKAPVSREIDETIRFTVNVPQEKARTRSHRWSQPADDGVLYETLGDLWFLEDGKRKNLTNSAAHETNPVFDLHKGIVYYASWTDDEFGAIYLRALKGGRRKRITTTPSQYGSLALSGDGKMLAYVCGAPDIRTGAHLERQTKFELHVYSEDDGNAKVTDIEWTSNRYGKRPPTIRFAPDNKWIFFTEYVADTLTMKRINMSGLGERTIYRFPNATRVVVSPNFEWIAFREYHRTFVTPFEFMGKTLTVSAADKKGFTKRVDNDEDGDFVEWTDDGEALYWTRGQHHCLKRLEDILGDGETVEKVDLSFEYEIDNPRSIIALTGVRVITMNGERDVIENATILVEDQQITAVGPDVTVPRGAKSYDLHGHTVMPGMFDAHGHYGSPISALNVIEQRLYGLRANLAYGVTTMYDVYGTTQKDFWVSDMLQAGKISGPRIYSVGDPVFVTKYRSKMHRPIASQQDADEVARFNKDHGAAALKDYSNHTRKARRQLARACRENGLNLVAESFADLQMNLTQLIDGFTGLEHTMGITPLYDDVLRLFEASDIGMTPTLIVVYNGPSGEQYFHMRERLWEDEKLLNFYRQDELVRYRRPRHFFDDDFYHMEMAAELKKLYERGGLLQMGAHGQMMGLGAHWEMEMFVHGGFTPHEAIEIATINGFTHHGLDHVLGSIEPGKLADLVVMAKNPLGDIRDSRSIVYVMKNGVLYSGDDASRIYPDPAPAQDMYFAGQ